MQTTDIHFIRFEDRGERRLTVRGKLLDPLDPTHHETAAQAFSTLIPDSKNEAHLAFKQWRDQRVDIINAVIDVNPKTGVVTVLNNGHRLTPEIQIHRELGSAIIKRYWHPVDEQQTSVPQVLKRWLGEYEFGGVHAASAPHTKINTPPPHLVTIRQSAIKHDPETGIATIVCNGAPLDPNVERDRDLAIEVVRRHCAAQAHHDDEESLRSTFATGLTQTTKPEVAEDTAIDKSSLTARLGALLQTGDHAYLWPGFNDVINEAITALTPVAQTPFDAASATTIELLQRGLLTDIQAADILAKHPCNFDDGGECLSAEGILGRIRAINDLQQLVHALNVHAGWWHDINTNEPLQRNDGELLLLQVSEIIEGFEGLRKDLMDDKLVTRKMIEVEQADALARMLDYCGGRGIDLAGALLHKLAYNTLRLDHKKESRQGANGKKF